MSTVEESIERAGTQLTQIVTAAKVNDHLHHRRDGKNVRVYEKRSHNNLYGRIPKWSGWRLATQLMMPTVEIVWVQRPFLLLAPYASRAGDLDIKSRVSSRTLKTVQLM